MIEKLGKIEFKGDIKKDKDISAIASFGNFLALGSDESKRKIQILQKQGAYYEVKDELEMATNLRRDTLSENSYTFSR